MVQTKYLVSGLGFGVYMVCRQNGKQHVKQHFEHRPFSVMI